MSSNKLLVFSDSHGFTESMSKSILTHSPDAVCHLGDYVRDAEKLSLKFPDIPFYFVRGNCDFCTSVPLDLCFSIFGFKIFACHGHEYSVKFSPLRLLYAAEECNAEICLFGHTHTPLLERRSGLTLLNPGASGDYGGCFALIEFNDGEFKAQILNM